jgi:type I site-specific restriction endonuclease
MKMPYEMRDALVAFVDQWLPKLVGEAVAERLKQLAELQEKLKSRDTEIALYEAELVRLRKIETRLEEIENRETKVIDDEARLAALCVEIVRQQASLCAQIDNARSETLAWALKGQSPIPPWAGKEP